MSEEKPYLRPVSDLHEERLVHVEHAQAELATKVAENALAIQYMGREVTEGFNRLADKIDACVAPLATQVHETHEHVVALGDVVGGHAKALERIAEDKKRVAEKWSGFRKALFTVLAGAMAIGLKELVVLFIHYVR